MSPMSPTLKRLLFGAYAYAENLLRLLLELLPPLLRHPLYRLLLARLGPGSMIDYQCYFRYPWKISIGAATSINRGCEFYGSMMDGSARIRVGDHVALGPRVRVLSAGHDYRELDLPDTSASVEIGNHVWVGAGSTSAVRSIVSLRRVSSDRPGTASYFAASSASRTANLVSASPCCAASASVSSVI